MQERKPGEASIDYPFDAEQVRHGFYDWAQSQIDKSGGALTHAEPRRSAEYQDFETTFYPWELSSQTVEIKQVQHYYRVAAVAERADKLTRPGDFRKFVEALKNHRDILNEIRVSVAMKESVAVLCNHPTLLNPAQVEAGVYCAFDDPLIAGYFMIYLNKMLGWLDVVTERGNGGEVIEQYPAMEMLTGFSNVGCVMPQTDSTTKYGLDEFRKWYNLKNRSQIRLMKNGQVVFMSASGSLDLMPDPSQNREHIEMKRANDQVERLLSRHVRKAWPILTWVDPKTKELSFHIGDRLISLDSPEAVHKLMQEMEEPYSRMASQSLGNIAVKYADKLSE